MASAPVTCAECFDFVSSTCPICLATLLICGLALQLSAQEPPASPSPTGENVPEVLEEKSLGPEHPNTLMGRHNLALLLGRENKSGEAETEFRAVAALEEKVLGPEHPDTLQSRMGLALSLSREGKVDEAKSIARH